MQTIFVAAEKGGLTMPKFKNPLVPERKPPKEIKHCEPDKRCASCMHYADGVCYRGTAPGYLEMREDDACTRWEGKNDDGES